jgi:transcription elongation factor GreB
VAEADRARALAHLAARRNELEDRLATATLVDASKQSHDEVRFGASVEVRPASGASRTYKIVGVDEAEPSAHRVAFVSPLARALLGRRVGEIVTMRMPRGEEELEIMHIDFEEPEMP